ncbi:MAG: NADH-quinone oxidoreductase subunit NuoF [Nitrospirota bacterium]
MTKVLFKNIENPDYKGDIDSYSGAGGYKGLEKALKEYSPQDIIDIVKNSGLRGRGGAGFPTGIKWSFIPKDPNLTKYLCCNADEGEPGTFKDRELMARDPHQLLEGMIITSYAIGINNAYIYIRGELVKEAKILEEAIKEAYDRGYLGKNILGRGLFDLEIMVHRGAGAYICGEESALLESLEGKRGQPRLKPPFPAIHGLYGKPTVINNVETLSNIPHIIMRGAEWFAGIGTQKSVGTKIFSISGHVKRPGNYELPFGIPLRELIFDYAGGMKNDKRLKAVIPGGSSAPVLTEEQLDVNMDFESVAAAGSMLGSGAVIVMDESTCMVWVALKLMEFYFHESCGKCTPCREGGSWMLQILERIEHGEGREGDIELLEHICNNMRGKTFCPFGDAEVSPVMSTIKHFRNEYESHIKEKICVLRKNNLVTVG